MSTGEKLYIRKTWRSEFPGLIAFGFMLIAASSLTEFFPGTRISGPLFTVLGYRLSLTLPLLWLIPAGWLILLTVRVYNVLYIADERGIEGYDGILSISQRITKIRYEDVRSLEMDQSIMERILDVGEIEVGTAGTSGVELCLQGVGSPHAIKEFINAKRDLGQKTQNTVQLQEPINS